MFATVSVASSNLRLEANAGGYGVLESYSNDGCIGAVQGTVTIAVGICVPVKISSVSSMKITSNIGNWDLNYYGDSACKNNYYKESVTSSKCFSGAKFTYYVGINPPPSNILSTYYTVK